MIVAIAIGALVLIVGVILSILLISRGMGSNNTKSVSVLPPNTCPQELKETDGKFIAMTEGLVQQMTQDDYNWVTQNCTFPTTSSSMPVLKNVSVNFGTYNETTNRSGDFLFIKNITERNWNTKKLVSEFGSFLESETQNTSMTFNQLDSSTNILAMVDGTVSKVDDPPGESKNYSIYLKFNDNWTIIYRHLRILKFSVRDKIKSGDILGNPSINKDGVTGYSEVEIMETKNGKTTYYCPVALLNPTVKTQIINQIAAQEKALEKFYGDNAIYNENAQEVDPGCFVENITL